MTMKVNVNRKLRKMQSEALLDFNKQYIIAVTAMTLWSVHKVFGCGKRKLRQLFEEMVRLNGQLERRYQLDAAEDEEWLYKKLLRRDLDIDIDAWWAEDKEAWKNEGAE
jgi:hypothetical protein